jgi:hypothetical protein
MTSFCHSECVESQQVAAMAQTFADMYARIQPLIAPDLYGQHVVINVMSGVHFVAATRSEAFEIARGRLGTTDYCWSRQIGPL